MTAAPSLRASDAEERMIGAHQSIVRLRDDVRRAAPLSAPVLIHGPTGAGKELVAELLHEQSGRRGRLVSVNVAALAGELAEAELFGAMRGAYTGAAVTRPGLIELAEDGTLHLDESADLPAALQVKLLRVLEGGMLRRVGGGPERPVRFRLVVSVQRPPDQLLAEGRWREDFYHRVAGIPLRVPPLRERRSDLGALSTHLLAALARPPLDAEVLRLLERYDWPGNVRELDRVLQRAVFLSGVGQIEVEHIRAAIATATRRDADGTGAAARARLSLAELQRNYLCEVLRECGGDVRTSAQLLGVPMSTLYRRLKAMSVKVRRGTAPIFAEPVFSEMRTSTDESEK
jgi:DNA-binding NtrC family response regulator